MCSSTNWGGVNLSGDKEGDRVRAKLVEERGEKVHRLEGMNPIDVGVVVVMEGGHDKEDEVEEESNLLHPLAAIQLVIDEESWSKLVCVPVQVNAMLTGKVISTKRNADIHQIPEPSGHD